MDELFYTITIPNTFLTGKAVGEESVFPKDSSRFSLGHFVYILGSSGFAVWLGFDDKLVGYPINVIFKVLLYVCVLPFSHKLLLELTAPLYLSQSFD